MFRESISFEGALRWWLLAPIIVFLVKFAVYSVLPFDWFVDHNVYTARTMEYGSGIVTIDLDRRARFDIRWSATKEIYRMWENRTFAQTIHTNHKDSFIFEVDSNDQLLALEVNFTDQPIPKGRYLILDHVRIYPMVWVTKDHVFTTELIVE